jgi:hypothetical protein
MKGCLGRAPIWRDTKARVRPGGVPIGHIPGTFFDHSVLTIYPSSDIIPPLPHTLTPTPPPSLSTFHHSIL